MLTRNLLIKFVAVVFVALMLAGLPASISAADDTWRPTLPPAGMGSVVLTNHFGQGREVILDLEGTLYKIPAKANDIPGRLQLNLAPDTYTYTASVAAVGAANRTVDVVAGQVINLSFVGHVEVKADNHRSKIEAEDQPAELVTYDDVLVYQEDITSQAQ
jgi:hypothetical protein